ncbi:hypothetical protein Q1695_000548 [Nippostrongylus brasiliensis]|nr:hypothetical protein Q1695_000548 [Nippostrongylus brasiliensis]
MTDIQRQINLLESQDSRVSDDARQALSLQLDLGNGIHQVVHYYGKTHSNRALDLLCKIVEPHDKTFLDSLYDSIKEKKIMATLDLLGQIVQTAPSWTPKIALHPVFKAILQHSVTTKELVECVGVLLFAAALLPHCSTFPPEVLNALFYTFIESCHTYRYKWLALDTKKSSDCWERADVAHIAFAIREFFHAIYGIYPTNFISYLRNHFVDKNGTTKSKEVATYVICPLLASVRVHPNLILVGKDKELSKDRWHQRESHDFLDDSRRVIIGKIPINAINDGFDVSSEPESPPPAPVDAFQLFPSVMSQDYCEWRNDESDNDLLSALNTPPHTNPSLQSQKRNTVDEEWSPLVITTDEKYRRMTDGSSSLTSLRNSIGLFFKKDRTNDKVSRTSPLSWVVEHAPETTFLQDGEQPEEAEEAVNCLTPTLDLPGSKRFSYSSHQCDPRTEGLRLSQAAQAAVLNKQRENYQGCLDSDDSAARSRSASFLFDGPHADDSEKLNIHHSDDFVNSGDNELRDSDTTPNNDNSECTRNRFSIGSFFSKLNRQRFASECHSITTCNKVQHNRCSQEGVSSLMRVSSCPDVISENRTPAGLARAEIGAKMRQENLLERFPYLRLIQPLGTEHYVEIEANLENEHEKRRVTYMEKSRNFHECLKEFGLADRLPGRIYDDMTHITNGLPMEKQRDILRARLVLVNQHLLYERSCRLLHANRNRRLFGRIKLQKVTDAELEQLKENLHVVHGERMELIAALSSLRRSINHEKRDRLATEGELLDRLREAEAEHYCLKENTHEISSQKDLIDSEAKKWKSQVEHYRRRIDDAEEQTRLLQLQLIPLESKIYDLRKAQTVNQLLRDQIRLLETRCENEPYLRFGQRSDRRERQTKKEIEHLESELISERNISEEYRVRAQEWEQLCKAESMRSTELKGLLDRATNLLREQKDAAEQKFLSLQAVVRKQEEHILDLYRRAEERDDALKRLRSGGVSSAEFLPVARIPSEIRSFDSSMSDVYIPRDVLYGMSPNEPRSSEEDVVLDLEAV